VNDTERAILLRAAIVALKKACEILDRLEADYIKYQQEQASGNLKPE
jgi:hypothetical protein